MTTHPTTAREGQPMSKQLSGWTRHGHRIDGMVQIGKPERVARCGGPGLCAECSVEAARRTDPMTPQHPAAPEGEREVGGLTEAEREAIGVHEAIVVSEDVYAAVERIVAERVRVVEGERDAAREKAEWWERTCTYWNEQATEAQRFRDLNLARAESAEAALAAEKEAHAALRAGVEALADEWRSAADGTWCDVLARSMPSISFSDAADRLRAVLAGGGE